MEKELIDYGYLQREIEDLIALVYDTDVPILKFKNESLNIIARRVKELYAEIEQLKEQKNEA